MRHLFLPSNVAPAEPLQGWVPLLHCGHQNESLSPWLWCRHFWPPHQKLSSEIVFGRQLFHDRAVHQHLVGLKVSPSPATQCPLHKLSSTKKLIWITNGCSSKWIESGKLLPLTGRLWRSSTSNFTKISKKRLNLLGWLAFRGPVHAMIFSLDTKAAYVYGCKMSPCPVARREVGEESSTVGCIGSAFASFDANTGFALSTLEWFLGSLDTWPRARSCCMAPHVWTSTARSFIEKIRTGLGYSHIC